MASNPKIRAFVDTNVLFSGFYSSRGVPRAIIGKFIEGEIGLVISQMVLDEIIRTVRSKLPEKLPLLRAFFIATTPEIQKDPSLEQVKRWSAKVPAVDAIILAAAINAKVDYFVTGDNHFLKPLDVARESGLKIVTPSEFIKRTS
jgi:putative PIN family toxin of toxin-antitoxin system